MCEVPRVLVAAGTTSEPALTLVKVAVSERSTTGSVPALERAAVLFKRSWRGGTVCPRACRLNWALPHRNTLAVPRDSAGSLVLGDATIHGPYLAAGPVGSDWRNRRLHLVLIARTGAGPDEASLSSPHRSSEPRGLGTVRCWRSRRLHHFHD